MGRHSPDDLDAFVRDLAVPHRARAAYWHLVLTGADALPAVRAGLRSPEPAVREHCALALDHLVDEESFDDLVGLLDDVDERVRYNALHALACDRCKDNACRPSVHQVLPAAIRLLRHDPSSAVRAMACEVVGRWVHDEPDAEAALVAVASDDPAASVRKKASWYAPGGSIHAKTAGAERR